MITLNTYAGDWPDTDDQAREIVDSVLGECLVRALDDMLPAKGAGQGPAVGVFQR
jgi:hypothetical protein